MNIFPARREAALSLPVRMRGCARNFLVFSLLVFIFPGPFFPGDAIAGHGGQRDVTTDLQLRLSCEKLAIRLNNRSSYAGRETLWIQVDNQEVYHEDIDLVPGRGTSRRYSLDRLGIPLPVTKAYRIRVWTDDDAEQASLSHCVQSPPPSGQARISVFKYNDANENRRHDKGEDFLEGWHFTLWIYTDGGYREVTQGLTGADGRLVFDGLGPGRYRIRETTPSCWEPTVPKRGQKILTLNYDQSVSAKFGNVFVCGGKPDYTLRKLINDQDANSPGQAVVATVGELLTFSYVVQNTGDTPVEWTGLLDDRFGDLSDECGLPVTIPVSQSASCEIEREAGDFPDGRRNIGTASVTGLPDKYDPAWYRTTETPEASYDFKKLINGQDADTLQDAVQAEVGESLNFTYIVENTGNTPIDWVGLVDDVFGNLATECALPVTVAVGTSQSCGILRTAGDFPDGKRNEGTSSVTDLADQKDPAWYRTPQPEPSYDFTKLINGEDADTLQNAVQATVDESLTFTYTVENTGNTPIDWVGLVDDVFGDLATECGLPMTVAVGTSESCDIQRTAGDFPDGKRNEGTSSVTDLADQMDPAWYRTPEAPSYAFKKFINGQDADTLQDAVQVAVDESLTFTYTVENTGNTPIDWVGLVDDVFGDLATECGLPLTVAVGTSESCDIQRTAGDFPDGKRNEGTSSVTDLADQNDPAWYQTPEGPEEPCIKLSKSIDGPYRTSDDLFLDDRIIPFAVQKDVPDGTDNTDNIFYFLVEITVANCSGTELTNVVVTDSFSNEAQPFETDDPGNVDIQPPPSDGGFVKETLNWTVGDIGAGSDRTLKVKVGTEFNPGGNLEPTSAPQTIFYNGQNDDTGSAQATADGGLSVGVGAMEITNGSDLGTCVGSDGEWDQLQQQNGPNVVPHSKCAMITTPLPIMEMDQDPPAIP